MVLLLFWINLMIFWQMLFFGILNNWAWKLNDGFSFFIVGLFWSIINFIFRNVHFLYKERLIRSLFILIGILRLLEKTFDFGLILAIHRWNFPYLWIFLCVEISKLVLLLEVFNFLLIYSPSQSIFIVI